MHTSHFKKYGFWKKKDGDNHRTNSLGSEYTLKFMDTATSLQDHSLLHAIAGSHIISGLCLEVAFFGQLCGARD